MIHYTCDICKRMIDPSEDLRYVVKIEISAVFEPTIVDEEDDRDHLQEIQELLEQLENSRGDEIGEDVHQELRFDLCPECRKRFVKTVLARGVAKLMDFSTN